MAHPVLRVIMIVLALGGLADALYFSLAYYGRIRHARWVPEILCAREGSNCVTVVQTSYARVFGVPNSLLGILYYLAIIVWAVFGSRLDDTSAWKPRGPLGDLLLAASILTVVLGYYLVHALRRRLFIDCPLCYAAHFINLVLLVLFLALRAAEPFSVIADAWS